MIFGCEGIHLSLGGREILHNIDVSAQSGQVLGIIGPNGAGKTTLFEVLSGRIAPDRGRVMLEGKDVTRLSIQQRVKRGISRTYQSPVVPASLTVGETLKAARKAFAPKLTAHQAEWACELVNFKVSHRLRSGALDTLGRRKLLMACLVMRRPKVLLLDEPASGLINAEIDELDHIIHVLAHDMQMALLVVEHRLELLGAIADDVMVLDVGQCIATGTPKTVFQNPEVRAAYFETVENHG